jgi:hypothetical protein
LTKLSLFAQPADFEPVLKVEAAIFPSFGPQDEGRSVHLNDIGKAAWLTALKLYTHVSLRLESYEGSGHEWSIVLAAPSILLSMRCVDYHQGLKLPLRAPRHFAVVMELQGDQFAVTSFVQKFAAQLGRAPSEMASWEEFTKTFGVSKEDVSAQWKYLLDIDIGENLKALYEEVKKEIEQAGAEGLTVAEQTRGLVLQAESAISEDDWDLTTSVLETARGILADARALARQEERRTEMAADMISYVQTIIIKAAQSGLDTVKAQKLLSGAAEALVDQDRETAIRNAMQARSLIELESHKRDKARAALQTSQSMISDAGDMGLDVGGLIQLQEKAEKALSGHNYGVVQHYATTIRKSISRLKQEHQKRLDKKEQVAYALDAARKVMTGALRFDCDVTKCADWILEAERALECQDHDRALERAEAARSSAEESMRMCSEALDAVQLATTTLNDARAFIDVAKIEPYLDRAWSALKSNKYADALNAASLCRDMIEVAEVEEEPRLEVSMKSKDLKPGIWNRVLLDIYNAGTAHARNISLKYSGLVEASRLRKIHFLRSGEGYTLEIGLKPAGAGQLAYDVETVCARAFDGVGYSSKTHRWLSVGMEGRPEAPPPQQAGREWEEESSEAPDDKAETAVEEVYIVFHDGRLIFHKAANPRQEMDEMSLSSLLTAVQEFIKDSFKSDGAGLGKLEFGRKKMVLEHGKFIYIAVVLTGRVPPGLRKQMRELLRYIETERFDGSGVWDGNMTELEDLHDSVQKILDIKYSEDPKIPPARPLPAEPPPERKKE